MSNKSCRKIEFITKNFCRCAALSWLNPEDFSSNGEAEGEPGLQVETIEAGTGFS
jgi:hypothetical protein